jgi:hypothetical protein
MTIWPPCLRRFRRQPSRLNREPVPRAVARCSIRRSYRSHESMITTLRRLVQVLLVVALCTTCWLQVRQLPIWAFHGARDRNVPISGSRNMIAAIRQLDGQARYTEYPDLDHFIWNRVFAQRDLVEWLFTQRNPATHSATARMAVVGPVGASPIKAPGIFGTTSWSTGVDHSRENPADPRTICGSESSRTPHSVQCRLDSLRGLVGDHPPLGVKVAGETDGLHRANYRIFRLTYSPLLRYH